MLYLQEELRTLRVLHASLVGLTELVKAAKEVRLSYVTHSKLRFSFFLNFMQDYRTLSENYNKLSG